MPRAIWTGSISFGLLNVPVRLYSAVSSRSIRFRELREKDGSRVRHKRVAEEDGEEVAYDEIVKGYEIAPDQYVVMTRDELEALDPKRSKTIEIEDFVDLDQIDPIYFNQPYYIGPAQGAERAYALLAQAMAEQRKVAIARFVMRNKESLAAIRTSADGEVLTLATMRFADEVVPTSDLEDVLGESEDVEPRKREIEMAKALIDSLATDFDPSSYRDEYREELMSLIERKAEGKSIAYASEAGTPLVADPGFQLARAAIAAGHSVLAAPGASAVLTALAVGGLPTDRFCFAGFPPAQGAARKAWLAELAPIPATLVLYESPKRIHRLLTELREAWGGSRDGALCRELTKRFEEVIRGTLDDVAAAIEGRDLKGEIVLLVGRATDRGDPAADLDSALVAALDESSLREAVDRVTAATGLPRRQVYQRALALSKEGE